MEDPPKKIFNFRNDWKMPQLFPKQSGELKEDNRASREEEANNDKATT